MASLPSKRPRLSLKIKTTGLRPDAASTALASALASAAAPAVDSRLTTPHLASSCPDTPLTATLPCPRRDAASVMTATPPLSAETDEPAARANAFAFCSSHLGLEARPDSQAHGPAQSPAAANARCSLPYTHPHSLHSILRNSPLSCRTTASTASLRRHHHQHQHHHHQHQHHSHHHHQRTSKRVEYDSPLTQEITTNTYTKSHIDLLAEDMSSPNSPLSPQAAPWPNEMQDAGQTPGPLDTLDRTTASRKRKRLADKHRHWVWTIDPDGSDDDDAHHGPSNRQPPPPSSINQLDPISPSLPLPSATSP
ncbi:hypothetical protein CDD81_3255 [Ophiocordyceps australis]|uniref:Uncharacterized protein n=1 Tax=Ophiocordyceps australis TaxID=1399860 RepID=A0A2C5YDS1_9HYPO|nr:hypothetical protein CDD81_3255 [Ophiocordyceps australis]